jgi:hypothetical protein
LSAAAVPKFGEHTNNYFVREQGTKIIGLVTLSPGSKPVPYSEEIPAAKVPKYLEGHPSSSSLQYIGYGTKFTNTSKIPEQQRTTILNPGTAP